MPTTRYTISATSTTTPAGGTPRQSIPQNPIPTTTETTTTNITATITTTTATNIDFDFDSTPASDSNPLPSTTAFAAEILTRHAELATRCQEMELLLYAAIHELAALMEGTTGLRERVAAMEGRLGLQEQEEGVVEGRRRE